MGALKTPNGTACTTALLSGYVAPIWSGLLNNNVCSVRVMIVSDVMPLAAPRCVDVCTQGRAWARAVGFVGIMARRVAHMSHRVVLER